MAEDLPAELDRGANDLRVVVADVAVQGRAGADAVLGARKTSIRISANICRDNATSASWNMT